MKKFTVLMAAVAMLLLSVLLTGCSAGTEVSLEPYISVNYRGNNGTATAVFDFDYADFEYAIMSQWDRGDSNFEKLAELTALELTMHCQPASLENVSNGDRIQVTVSYDRDKAEESGYVFRDVSKTFVVEGLQEAILLDPFDPEFFSLSVTGFSPKLSVTAENTAEGDNPLRRVQYTLDKQWDLRNGDTVTVTASFMPGYNMEQYALSRREITLPIGDMDCYLTDLSTLSADDMQAIQDKALEFYNRDSYMDIVCADGSQVSLTEENRQNAQPPEFLGHGYTVLETYWGTQSTLVLPFRLFLEDARFQWWEGTYQDPVLEQDLQLYGCFHISGLVQTASGDLIREGDFSIRLEDFYLTEEALEQAIREAYTGEELIRGTFGN